MLTIALAHLMTRGVRFESPEAVAIARTLMEVPAGVPVPGNVQLSAGGSASCIDAQGTPSVFDFAALLQALLPPGKATVSAPLRYAIARGLGSVEAPSFDSIADFSLALQRFETGERREVVRNLLRRVATAPSATSAPRPVPARPPAAASGPPAARRPISLPSDPADIALLHAATADAISPGDRISPDRPDPPRSRLGLAMAAAIVASFGAGFSLMELVGEPVKVKTAGAPDATTALGPASLSRPAPAEAATIPAPVRAVATSGRTVERVRLSGASDGPAFSPAFGSNGTAIFFHTGGNQDPRSAIEVATSDKWPASDLGIMTIVDDGARNYHAQPSPDGRFVAFDSDRDGERAVYVANRDGSDVRRVTGEGYAAGPTWSPDGARLAYIRAEAGRPGVWNLWTQPVGGSQATRLTNHRYGQTWTASWFPDGRRVTYTHDDKVIILDTVTGESRQFSSPLKGRALRTPAVSPDGSTIIFQVARHGAWLLDLADASMRCVLEDPDAEEFAWTPDGRRVAFHSRRDGRWGIYLLGSPTGSR